MLTTQCLCTKLRRAARSVTKIYDDALAGVGLSAAQFSLLRHLQRLDRPSISSLAEAMGLDRSTLGRNLKILQVDGLVLLEDGADQRNRLVCLSKLGLARLTAGSKAWHSAQQQLAEYLGEDKRETLMLLLDELECLD